MNRPKVIIDTDPGIDDAMAIFYALSHPGIDLVGLTSVFGNVPVATATRNALTLVEMAGADVPVAGGAARPLLQNPKPHPDFVHGAEGFGDVAPRTPGRAADPRDAATFLCETLAAHPGEVTVIAVGPLTNLALALEQDRAIATRAARVIVMGGSARAGGNVTPHAEANFWQDPHAAARVLAAPWPVTMVGLDITQDVRCGPADFEEMAMASPTCGPFLRQAAAFYCAFHKDRAGFHGCYLHDPTAVIALTDPGLIVTEPLLLAIDLDGEASGRSYEAPSGTKTDVALGVDATAVRARFLEILGSGRLP